MTNYQNLVLSGGGVKAIAFIGSLEYLDEIHILKNMHRFAGSSAGSIIAGLLAIRYPLNEIKKIMYQTDFSNFLENEYVDDISNLISKYGIYSTNKLYNWIGKLIAATTNGDPDFTFQQVYDAYKTELVITTSCINQVKTIYYHYKLTPNLPIREAIRRSFSIPLFFEANFINNDILVDGGTFSNYPIWVFDNKIDINDEDNAFNAQTLGLKLLTPNRKENNLVYFNGNLKTDNVYEYMISLIDCLLIQIEKLHINKNYWQRTVPIHIPEISLTTFSLSEKLKQELINDGYNSTKKWFENKLN